MTPVELAQWQRRNGLRSDAEAGAALGVSPRTFWRKRHGKTRISRQTEMLCAYYELRRELDPLRLAEMGEVINKLIRLSVSRR